MKLRWFILCALCVAFLQSAALGKIIYDRASLIQSGTEVTLQSGMVDPRDLFRGHYVILNLTIGRINSKEVELGPYLKIAAKDASQFVYDNTIYLSLRKGDDEFWVADAIFKNIPTEADGPFIRGEYQGTVLAGNAGSNGGDTHRIHFPIDRFFAEKFRAKDLEKVRRDRKLGVVVALDDKGGAAIKGISVAGELIYNEPIW